MTEKLLYSNRQATVWYHEFVAISYFTPLLGALVADAFIGKYRTILILSMVYVVGNVVMAVTSVGRWFPEDITTSQDGSANYQPQLWGPILGLHLIALGTGGIKPCVSSLGGDQFLKSEGTKLQSYFSMFYFSINCGGVLAMFITPELRSSKCMDETTCFPLAFGVPAVFMILAVISFVLASKWYVKIPPLGNPITDYSKVIWAMLTRRKMLEDNFGIKKVQDTRQLLRVLFVLSPIPFFWALYSQQGSRWIIQAKRMNGKLGNVVIKPDQMQVFNPLLVLSLLPFFEGVVYPLLRKNGLKVRATSRMVAGMVFVALAFVVCGFVELSMEARVATWNEDNVDDKRTLDTLDPEHQLHILATLPQIFLIGCGEVLTVVTGLEFAYAYAPSSTKSVCSSFFLLTHAFGNVITIIFTNVTDRDLYLYFMWAGIELSAAITMFIICWHVQDSLDRSIQQMHTQPKLQESKVPVK
ncbi:solute carrier family 15 member 1-like isoform X2 [Bolinopsis microptera]